MPIQTIIFPLADVVPSSDVDIYTLAAVFINNLVPTVINRFQFPFLPIQTKIFPLADVVPEPRRTDIYIYPLAVVFINNFVVAFSDYNTIIIHL